MDFPIRETIEKRRSVRTYETRPLSREDRERLTSYAARIENPFGVPVRIGLIETERSEQPKKLGTYGVIKGAGSFLGIAAPQDKLGLEAAGYAMEKLVLYATHLGLGTCWLAGTLNREGFTRAMHTGEDEWMPAITPVGYAAEKPSFHEQLMRSTMKSARRKPWKELFFRADFKTPLTEADTGAYAEPLELLRLAPSATNAQPWRVVMDGQFFHYSLANYPGHHLYWRSHDRSDLAGHTLSDTRVPPEQLAWFADIVEKSQHPCVIASHASFERANGSPDSAAVRKIIDDTNRRHPGRIRLVLNGHHHRDHVRILENVIYVDVNSANYDWFLKEHDKYPASYVKKWQNVRHCIFWDDPISAMVSLYPSGRICFEGQRSRFHMGITPSATGNNPYDRAGRPTSAEIQSFNIWGGTGERRGLSK